MTDDFFFLRMRLRPIVGQPGNSSSSSRVKLGQTTVQRHKRAGFDDVGHRLGLTTGAQISVCKTPSWWLMLTNLDELHGSDCRGKTRARWEVFLSPRTRSADGQEESDGRLCQKLQTGRRLWVQWLACRQPPCTLCRVHPAVQSPWLATHQFL